MSGFGQTLSKGIDRAVEARQREDEDAFKYTFENFLTRKAKLTTLEENQAKTARRAKEYAEMYGQDAGSARQIYDWLDSGMSDAAVTDRLENYKLTPVEGTPAPAKIDTQMADSGLDPRASTAPETDPQKRMVQRSIGRIAEITGESPDAIGNVMAGRSKPPEIGTGQVGSFKLVPKDVSPDKLTDADIAARYTKLQTDVANGVEGAQTRLEVFEKVTLPAYRNSKQALDSPTGENVLPDLLYRYGRAPEGSPERKQMAGQIEAYRRAAELKSGDTADGYQQSVIFKSDGTTDLQRVRTIRDVEGNEIHLTRIGGQDVRVEGDVMPMTKEMREGMAELYKMRTNDVVKYEDQMTRTADSLRLTDEIFQLVDSDRNVLTKTAGFASGVTDAAREVFTATETLRDLAKRNGAVTEQEIEKALGGSVESVEAKINDALGQQFTDTAHKRALLDSKLLLAGFRLGGLEGQSGNGLSNADFDRILTIVNSSNDPDVFKKAWSDYVQGRIQQVDMKAQLANGYNGALDSFESQWGFRPTDNVVTSLSDYITKSGDEELTRAYQTVEGIANKPLQKPAIKSPGDPANPLANPPQNAPETITQGGKTLQLIEVLPDGRARYKDPETGRTGTMPVAGNGEAPSDGRKIAGKTPDGRTVYELPDGRKIVRKRD